MGRKFKMRHGSINCDCGSLFYFETNASQIKCINCGKAYETKNYPVKQCEEETTPEDR
jgi:hypothetical protein